MDNICMSWSISAWDCYGAQSKSAKLYRAQISTPSRRISYYAADLAAETEENRYKEVLDQLVAKQWTVYRVSPLWNVPWKESARNQVTMTSTIYN